MSARAPQTTACGADFCSGGGGQSAGDCAKSLVAQLRGGGEGFQSGFCRERGADVHRERGPARPPATGAEQLPGAAQRHRHHRNTGLGGGQKTAEPERQQARRGHEGAFGEHHQRLAGPYRVGHAPGVVQQVDLEQRRMVVRLPDGLEHGRDPGPAYRERIRGHVMPEMRGANRLRWMLYALNRLNPRNLGRYFRLRGDVLAEIVHGVRSYDWGRKKEWGF